MWGISGDVGEIYRKQQSDALKDQLLQQTLAQRIKEFEQEQQLRREELRQRADESAANRRQDANRLGLEEMRMTRQQMTEDEARTQREGAQRAVSNIQGLIPFRQSPQFRDEVSAQALRVDPEQAVRELLKPTPEQEDERLQRQREIIEKTQAKYAPPQRPPVPIVVMTPQGPQVVDRTTRTAAPITGAGGDTVGLVPTAEQRNRQAGRQAARPFIDAASELADRINVNQGLYAKAVGAVEKQAAKVNLDDDVAEYQAMVQSFTPMWARALGHTGVLTEQDVQSAKAILPAPGDSKSLKDRKIARIQSVLDAAAAAAVAQPGAAPNGGSAGPKVGDTKQFPNGKKGRWDGKGWELIQ
jgi:hypothetical protein